MRGARIFLAGQAVSELGDGLALLAIPLLVLSLTQSPVAAVLASLPPAPATWPPASPRACSPTG